MPDPINQASFIPKKNMGPSQMMGKQRRTINVFMIFAVLVFVVSIGLAAGAYWYKSSQTQVLSQKKEELQTVRSLFDSSQIAQLASLDTRMKSAENLLAQHTALTFFYEALALYTLETVSFSSFDYQNVAGGQVNIVMTGEAESFASIALQADSFSQSEAFRSPLFTNFNINTDDTVNFSLVLPVDPTLLLYSNNFK